MTKDDIICLPHPNLRLRSAKVNQLTDNIFKVIDNMKLATVSWDISRDHEVGVALAAVQINQLYRIIIVRDNYEDKNNHDFTAFINPKITKLEGKLLEDYEGCLSVPNIYGKVKRYEKVRVKAQDINGKEFRITADGFLARIFQHEIDHCEGKLFIDHIKNKPDAFFELDQDGQLNQLDYEKDIRNNHILW